MEFTWSERKRALNLKEHKLDFVDATSVFEGLTYRSKMTGSPTASSASSLSVFLQAFQSQSLIRRTIMKSAIISFRKATNREAQIYFSEIQN